MELLVARDYEDMSRKAAEIIADQLRSKPESVLGLATGSTPLGTYEQLVKMYRDEKLSFSEASAFNLDEYYGLSPEHEQSYSHYMKANLFRHIDIKPENIHIPNGMAEDMPGECENYDRLIEKKGGIDLQLLGVGANGHIGFNEPDKELQVNTHLVRLTEDTIRANSRFFNSADEVPVMAVTMGLGSIMKAKRILLLASGSNKAEVIARIISGKCSTRLPASILQVHPGVTVIVDSEIGNYLKETGGFKNV